MVFVNSFDDSTSSISSNLIENESLLSSLKDATPITVVQTTLASENNCLELKIDHQRQKFNNTIFNTIIDTELTASANNSYQPNLLYSASDNSNSINKFNTSSNLNNTLIYNNKSINETNSNNNLYNFDMCYDTSNLSVIAASIAAATINQNTNFDPLLMQVNFNNDNSNINSNLKAMPPTSLCGFCQEKIEEKIFTLISNQSWHTRCVRCVSCLQPLDFLPTCFMRNGLFYCKQDYMAKFCKCCERCHQKIMPGEEIMIATQEKTFHLSCFTCVLCNHTMKIGETYFLGDAGALFCHKHYETLNQNPFKRTTIKNNNEISNANGIENTTSNYLTEPNLKLKDAEKLSQNNFDYKKPVKQLKQQPEPKNQNLLVQNQKNNLNNASDSTNSETLKQNKSPSNYLKLDSNYKMIASTSSCFFNDNSNDFNQVRLNIL